MKLFKKVCAWLNWPTAQEINVTWHNVGLSQVSTHQHFIWLPKQFPDGGDSNIKRMRVFIVPFRSQKCSFVQHRKVHNRSFYSVYLSIEPKKEMMFWFKTGTSSKKNSSRHTHKRGSWYWYLLGALFKISDEHPHLFWPGSQPPQCRSLIQLDWERSREYSAKESRMPTEQATTMSARLEQIPRCFVFLVVARGVVNIMCSLAISCMLRNPDSISALNWTSKKFYL